VIYCDYNASSPLTKSVKDFLGKGDLFANPSSQHSLGKQAAKLVLETEIYLKNFFHLPNYSLFFHSGSTEGINSIILGLNPGKDFVFFYSTLDHSAVTEQVERVKRAGGKVVALVHDQDGNFDLEKNIELLGQHKSGFLNYTCVNNETGVVWPLEYLKDLKKAMPGLLIHVDATQLPGKIKDYDQLNDAADFYTFSGHKFGALKGVGWSFVRDENKIRPIFLGGDQQHLRSGTINAPGIYTLKLALEDLKKNQDFSILEKCKNEIEKKLLDLIAKKGAIVCQKAKWRNLTTICFYLKDYHSDKIMPMFDLAGLAIGTGSACSSGVVKANRIMQEIGLENFALHNLRISINPTITVTECSEIVTILEKVLWRL
jgi:cysteine desulfurase